MDTILQREGWDSTYTALLATVVSAATGLRKLGGYYIYNPNATVAYIQVFNKALVADVTLGTTVPDLVFAIPATGAANLELTNGRLMRLGIMIAATTTATGLTAMGAACTTNIFYK